MPEVISDTSPLQYLHQLGLLLSMAPLVEQLIVPPAVIRELSDGRACGYAVPEIERISWVSVRQPKSLAVLPLAADLGPGEAEVLALALESSDPVVVLDDRLARQVATMLHLRLTGTLGLLLDAKHAGIIASVRPHLDRLTELRFRLAETTRRLVLEMAGELP